MSTRIKASYLFLAFIPHFVLYLLIQSWIGTSQYNLLTAFDTKIPFMPPFVWVYHTLIPVIFLTGILLFQRKNIFFGLVTSIIFAGVVLCLFYVLFPAFYPREMFVDTTTISGWLIEMTRVIDGPHNTFPSGHVTFAWLLVFFVNLSQYVKKHQWVRIAYFSWATLISISTLTLKQHYIVDVISGIVLASLAYFLARRLFVKEPSEQLITSNVELFPSRNFAE